MQQSSNFDERLEDFTIETQSLEDIESTTDHLDMETTTATASSTERSRRKKRHINYYGNSNSVENNAYTMEVMVAVDRKMKEYHRENLKAYVLTLMSIVSDIYADASIGNSINVAVVHILVLNDDLHVESNHVGKWMIYDFLLWLSNDIMENMFWLVGVDYAIRCSA